MPVMFTPQRRNYSLELTHGFQGWVGSGIGLFGILAGLPILINMVGMIAPIECTTFLGCPQSQQAGLFTLVPLYL